MVKISKRDQNTDLEKEAKRLYGYVWCRVHDLLNDFESNREAVILSCLNVLEEAVKD